MKRTLFVLCVLAAAAAAVAGCDKVRDMLDADPAEPCGRYCIKCSDCKEDEATSTFKEIIDYTCAVDDLGRACQELCDQANKIVENVNIKGNVEAVEKEKGIEITDKNFTCADFAYGVVTGEVDSPCSRFCKKCVECAQTLGADATVEWCAKQDGLVCALTCKDYWQSYVIGFEDIAKENSGIQSLKDIDCNDWKGTAEKAGDRPE